MPTGAAPVALHRFRPGVPNEALPIADLNELTRAVVADAIDAIGASVPSNALQGDAVHLFFKHSAGTDVAVAVPDQGHLTVRFTPEARTRDLAGAAFHWLRGDVRGRIVERVRELLNPQQGLIQNFVLGYSYLDAETGTVMRDTLKVAVNDRKGFDRYIRDRPQTDPTFPPDRIGVEIITATGETVLIPMDARRAHSDNLWKMGGEGRPGPGLTETFLRPGIQNIFGNILNDRAAAEETYGAEFVAQIYDALNQKAEIVPVTPEPDAGPVPVTPEEQARIEYEEQQRQAWEAQQAAEARERAAMQPLQPEPLREAFDQITADLSRELGTVPGEAIDAAPTFDLAPADLQEIVTTLIESRALDKAEADRLGAALANAQRAMEDATGLRADLQTAHASALAELSRLLPADQVSQAGVDIARVAEEAHARAVQIALRDINRALAAMEALPTLIRSTLTDPEFAPSPAYLAALKKAGLMPSGMTVEEWESQQRTTELTPTAIPDKFKTPDEEQPGIGALITPVAPDETTALGTYQEQKAGTKGFPWWRKRAIGQAERWQRREQSAAGYRAQKLAELGAVIGEMTMNLNAAIQGNEGFFQVASRKIVNLARGQIEKSTPEYTADLQRMAHEAVAGPVPKEATELIQRFRQALRNTLERNIQAMARFLTGTSQAPAADLPAGVVAVSNKVKNRFRRMAESSIVRPDMVENQNDMPGRRGLLQILDALGTLYSGARQTSAWVQDDYAIRAQRELRRQADAMPVGSNQAAAMREAAEAIALATKEAQRAIGIAAQQIPQFFQALESLVPDQTALAKLRDKWQGIAKPLSPAQLLKPGPQLPVNWTPEEKANAMRRAVTEMRKSGELATLNQYAEALVARVAGQIVRAVQMAQGVVNDKLDAAEATISAALDPPTMRWMEEQYQRQARKAAQPAPVQEPLAANWYRRNYEATLAEEGRAEREARSPEEARQYWRQEWERLRDTTAKTVQETYDQMIAAMAAREPSIAVREGETFDQWQARIRAIPGLTAAQVRAILAQPQEPYEPKHPGAKATEKAKREQEMRDFGEPLSAGDVAPRVWRNMTREERKLVTDRTAEKLVSIFDNLPGVEEIAAVAEAGSAKRGWYERSARALLSIFGLDAPRFAGLLAATSPQTGVPDNLYNALSIWKNWIASGRPTDRAIILKIMGQSVMGSGTEASVLDAWKANSILALTHDFSTGPLRISGPKVNSFMLNLLGNTEEVTNDAWMANFFGIDQKLFAGQLRAGSPLKGKGPGYIAAVARVRAAAKYLSERSGEKWTPSEVRETVWSWAKALYEMQSGGLTAVDALERGLLTDEMVGDTPDFAALFSGQTRYHQLLEEAGYGQKIAELKGTERESGRGDADRNGGRAAHTDFASGKTGSLAPEARRRSLRRAAERLTELKRLRDADKLGLGSLARFGRKISYHAGSGENAGRGPRAFARGRVVGLSPTEFSRIAGANKAAHPFGTSVDVYDPRKYRGYDLIVVGEGDQTATISVAPDGEVGAVTKSAAAPSGYVDVAFEAALSLGRVKWLNGFDTILPARYSKLGFEARARLPFNDEYAPEGWDYARYAKYNDGRPDVVFMAYTGQRNQVYADVQHSIPTVSSYDEGRRLALFAGEVTPAEGSLADRAAQAGRVDLDDAGFRRYLADAGLVEENEDIDPEDANKYVTEWRDYNAQFNVPLQASEVSQPDDEFDRPASDEELRRMAQDFSAAWERARSDPKIDRALMRRISETMGKAEAFPMLDPRDWIRVNDPRLASDIMAAYGDESPIPERLRTPEARQRLADEIAADGLVDMGRITLRPGGSVEDIIQAQQDQPGGPFFNLEGTDTAGNPALFAGDVVPPLSEADTAALKREQFGPGNAAREIRDRELDRLAAARGIPADEIERVKALFDLWFAKADNAALVRRELNAIIAEGGQPEAALQAVIDVHQAMFRAIYGDDGMVAIRARSPRSQPGSPPMPDGLRTRKLNRGMVVAAFSDPASPEGRQIGRWWHAKGLTVELVAGRLRPDAIAAFGAIDPIETHRGYGEALLLGTKPIVAITKHVPKGGDLESTIDELVREGSTIASDQTRFAEDTSDQSRPTSLRDSFASLEAMIPDRGADGKSNILYAGEVAPESLTTADDARYLEAVEAGDLETAQRMVDEAAKRAGYNVGPVYHGTPYEWTEWNPEATWTSTLGASGGLGAFFADTQEEARHYARAPREQGRVVAAYLRLHNPKTIEAWSPEHERAVNSKADAAALRKELMAQGYDGAIMMRGGRETVVFSPSQIKSADPVTYKDGKPVPLSERFNAKSDSILEAGEVNMEPGDPRPAPGEPLSKPPGEQARRPMTAEQREAARQRAIQQWFERRLNQIDLAPTLDPQKALERDAQFANPVDPAVPGGREAHSQATGAYHAARELIAKPGSTVEDLAQGIGRETVKQWDDAADDLIRRLGPTKVASDLVKKVQDGELLDRIETRAGKKLISWIWRDALASGDPKARLAAQKLSHAVWAVSGTAQAQALRARADDFMTPAERVADFVGGLMSRLSPAEQERIDRITDPKAREQATDDALMAEQARIEEMLRSAGYSLPDLFMPDAVAALRASPAMQRALQKVAREFEPDTAKQKSFNIALRMIQHGFSDREIGRETRLRKSQIKALSASLDAALAQAFGPLVQAGMTLARATESGVLSAPSLGQIAEARAEEQRAIISALNAEQRAILRAMMDAARVQSSLRNSPHIRRILTPGGGAVVGERGGRPRYSGTYRFDPTDVRQIIQLAHVIQAGKADGWDVEDELWKSSILTGAVGLGLNVYATPINAAFNYIIDRSVQSAVNMVVRDPNSAQGLIEWRYLLQGMAHGFTTALQTSASAFELEHSMFEQDWLNQPVGLEDIVERGGGRVSMSEELWFQMLGGRAWQRFADLRRDGLAAGMNMEDATAMARSAIANDPAYRAQQRLNAVEDAVLGMVPRRAQMWVRALNPTHGSSIRMPFRIMLWADTFNKAFLGGGERQVQAYRIAKRTIHEMAWNEGLRGRALQARIQELSRELVDTEALRGDRGEPFSTQAAAFAAARAAGLTGYTPRRAAGEPGWIVTVKRPRFQAIMNAQVMTPGSEAHVKAVEEVQRLALQSRLRTGREGGGVIESVVAGAARARYKRRNTLRGNVGRYFLNKGMPFVATLFNASKLGLGHAPLFSSVGLVKRLAAGTVSWARGDGFQTAYPQELMVRDLADNVIAYAAAILLYGICEGDDDDDKKPFLLTGSHSYGTEPKGEIALNQRTMGPAMFRTPWGTFDFSRYEPQSTGLVAAIDLIRAHKRLKRGSDPVEETGKIALSILGRIQAQPFAMQTATLAKLAAAVTSSPQQAPREITRFLTAVVTGYIPNWIRQPMRNLDDTLREQRNAPAWKAMLYNALPMGDVTSPWGGEVPWALPPKVDLLGREVNRQLSDGPQRLARLVVDTGFDPSSPDHPYNTFLRNYQLQNFGAPEGSTFPTVTGIDSYLDLDSPKADKHGQIKLTPEELYALRVMAGNRFADEVMTMLNPEDIAVPSATKFRDTVSLYHKIAEQARNQMFPMHKRFEKMDRNKRDEYRRTHPVSR